MSKTPFNGKLVEHFEVFVNRRLPVSRNVHIATVIIPDWMCSSILRLVILDV